MEKIKKQDGMSTIIVNYSDTMQLNKLLVTVKFIMPCGKLTFQEHIKHIRDVGACGTGAWGTHIEMHASCE